MSKDAEIIALVIIVFLVLHRISSTAQPAAPTNNPTAGTSQSSFSIGDASGYLDIAEFIG